MSVFASKESSAWQKSDIEFDDYQHFNPIIIWDKGWGQSTICRNSKREQTSPHLAEQTQN